MASYVQAKYSTNKLDPCSPTLFKIINDKFWKVKEAVILKLWENKEGRTFPKSFYGAGKIEKKVWH